MKNRKQPSPPSPFLRANLSQLIEALWVAPPHPLSDCRTTDSEILSNAVNRFRDVILKLIGCQLIHLLQQALPVPSIAYSRMFLLHSSRPCGSGACSLARQAVQM